MYSGQRKTSIGASPSASLRCLGTVGGEGVDPGPLAKETVGQTRRRCCEAPTPFLPTARQPIIETCERWHEKKITHPVRCNPRA